MEDILEGESGLKTYNIRYTQEPLDTLPITEINRNQSILIQVFSGICDIEYLEKVRQDLIKTFPGAIIIGTTTDGEIYNAQVTTNEVIVSITTFAKSSLKKHRIENLSEAISFKAGQELAQILTSDDAKVLITFSDGLNTNAEELLNGISSINKKLIVAGGMAADNGRFQKTYLFDNDGVWEKSLIAVVIKNPSLQVTTDYKLNWQPIGKMLKVTYAEGNRVYSIDNKNPVEIYRHYLGDKVADKLPKTGVEFPLVTKQNGVLVTRAVLQRHEDDSLSFGGNMQTGEHYQFAFANIESAKEDTSRLNENIQKIPVESIFVYSCMARRRFSQSLTEYELSPLAKRANVSGFFTYGEFYHNEESNNLLNQSMTILALSEGVSNNKNQHHTHYFEKKEEDQSSTMEALSHLITVASSELEEMSRKNKTTTEHVLVNDGPVIYWKMDFDDTHKITFISSNIANFLGYNAEEFLNHKVDFLQLLPSKDRKTFLQKVGKALNNKDISIEGEFSLRAADRQNNYFHYFISIERTCKGSVTLHSYMIDITRRKMTEKQIHYLAYNDALTGLYNRTRFEKLLEQSIEKALVKRFDGALLFLDLNRFKGINDTLGHHVGDAVLKETAKRLLNVIKEEGYICRLGGDEFVVILPKLSGCDIHKKIKDIAACIHSEVEKGINVFGETLFISTSIGAAIFPQDAKHCDAILKCADIAMYQAKKEHNTHVVFYHPRMQQTNQESYFIETHLRHACTQKEFELLYQPQIDIYSGMIVGAEALLRWHSPKLGTISPDTFIPIAEQTGQIIELGEWVLKEACSKIHFLETQEDLPKSFKKISVNISALQFKQENFVEKVLKIIDESGINPVFLELELTEGALIDYIEEAIDKITRLKRLGITFSIDDFGTGYSSLAYLKKFPIDILKIDKSFIQDIDVDIDDAILTETIIQMSKNLRLGVIAEGVEKVEHLDFLKEHGCHMCQGYLFSKPISFELFLKLLLHKERDSEKTMLIKV